MSDFSVWQFFNIRRKRHVIHEDKVAHIISGGISLQRQLKRMHLLAIVSLNPFKTLFFNAHWNSLPYGAASTGKHYCIAGGCI